MAATIAAWPLRRVALRFIRTGRGTYQAVVGEAPPRTRYAIAGQHRRWCVERLLQQPGGGWATISVQLAASLKAAMDRCEADARETAGLPSPAVAARLSEPCNMAGRLF